MTRAIQTLILWALESRHRGWQVWSDVDGIKIECREAMHLARGTVSYNDFESNVFDALDEMAKKTCAKLEDYARSL